MRPITVPLGPFAAAAAANVVASNTPVSGTPLTLLTTTPDAVPRRLLVSFGIEGGNRTLLVTGTNWAGNTISETINIPSGGASTAISALDYKTVTSILPGGGGWTAAMTVGTTNATTVASSPWVRLDDYGLGPVSYQVDETLAGGTLTWTLEQSNDDPNLVAPQVPVAPAAMIWNLADATIGGAALAAGGTASKSASTQARPLWARLTATAYTGAAFAALTVSQAGGKHG